MQTRFINAKLLRMTDVPVVEEQLQVWVENGKNIEFLPGAFR